MALTRDIAATYRHPRVVLRRLLAMGEREDRALVMLMAGCILMFVAQWPRLSRIAYESGRELNPLLGGSLFAWVMIAPLLFYALAFLSYLVLRALGQKCSGYATRLALFWAFLAATPLILLHGLVAGFIGPGPEQVVVGALWLLAFLWFWMSNLREAGWHTQ